MTFNQVVGGSIPPCLICNYSADLLIPAVFCYKGTIQTEIHYSSRCSRTSLKEIRGYGEIGRRARFRFWWAPPCRFESCYPHHRKHDMGTTSRHLYSKRCQDSRPHVTFFLKTITFSLRFPFLLKYFEWFFHRHLSPYFLHGSGRIPSLFRRYPPPGVPGSGPVL